jgi:hypothetical protein
MATNATNRDSGRSKPGWAKVLRAAAAAAAWALVRTFVGLAAMGLCSLLIWASFEFAPSPFAAVVAICLACAFLVGWTVVGDD